MMVDCARSEPKESFELLRELPGIYEYLPNARAVEPSTVRLLSVLESLFESADLDLAPTPEVESNLLAVLEGSPP